MRQTYCEAKMIFVDVSALEDSTPITNDNQDFADITIIKDNIAQKDYGTMEMNQFVLDGSKSVFQEHIEDVSFMSEQMSDEDCLFSSNPIVTIQFSKAHTSAGITLTFPYDYPEQIKVTWYTMGGTKIISKVFDPDGLVFVCREQVDNYGRIDIEFIKTRLPYQYARLQNIQYGIQILWNRSELKSANVLEEIDITSATLSINTANVSIIDTKNDFDISNEDGAWKSVQKTQEVDLCEYINGERVPVGTFFIQDKSFADNVASFSLIDAIGLMDQYTFYNGAIYQNEKAGVILEQIFSAAKISKYDISEEVYNTELSGTLAIQSCREALQMVCFVCGAVADDSRSDTIHVYKPDRYVKYTIPIGRKFNGNTKVELAEYVSGVSVEYNKYDLAQEVSEIYNDYLPVGDTRIEFSDPYDWNSIAVSGGTIVEAMTNYVVVRMSAPGNCLIKGKKYESSTFAYGKNVEYLDSGETENVKVFGTCTLYNPEILKETTQRLLNYYALRKSLSMKYIVDLEQVGNWVNVNNRNGKSATSLITSQSIDLTGGYIGTAQCVGYSIVVTDYAFTGNELYASGGMLL